MFVPVPGAYEPLSSFRPRPKGNDTRNVSGVQMADDMYVLVLDVGFVTMMMRKMRGNRSRSDSWL